MELIWSKKAFHAVKESLPKGKYIQPGAVESLNLKPGDASVPVSQQKDNVTKTFNPPGQVEKLEYPTKKESSMNKESAQSLPGSDKINAAEAIDKGEKGKLQFPTGPAKDPAVKGHGMAKDTEAQKQISEGPKGDIKHGGGEGKSVKIQWNVATDAKIGQEFMDGGEKGEIKSAPAHAKEPGVSQTKVPGADAHFDSYESTKPIQKQFSINWRRASAEEKAAVLNEAIDSSILNIEVAAAQTGTKLESTRLAPIHAALVEIKKGLAKEGAAFVTTLPEPAKPAEAPLRATAAAKQPTEADQDAAAEKTGRMIF